MEVPTMANASNSQPPFVHWEAATAREGSSVNAFLARAMAVAFAFLLVSFLVLNSSRAAFSDATDNSANAVSTGTIDLSDNDAGAAMFGSVANLAPGTVIDRCIDVAYTGSYDPTAVVLYMPTAPTGSLAPYLDLAIEIGADTTDAFGTCTNFVASSTLYTGTVSGLRGTHSSYLSGLATWDPTGTSTRTFRFRISVQDNNLAQGLATTFGITWEVQAA
jgi:hypothetical protein